MSDFVAGHSVTVSIGNAAAAMPSVGDPVLEKSGNSPHGGVSRRWPQVRITNTHDTQLLYYKYNGVDADANDAYIGPSQSKVFPAPLPDTGGSLFANGASTTGVVEFGSVM